MTKCKKCGHELPERDAYEEIHDGDVIRIIVAWYCPYCGDEHYEVLVYRLTDAVNVAKLMDFVNTSPTERNALVNLMWEEKKYQNSLREPKNILEMLGE